MSFFTALLAWLAILSAGSLTVWCQHPPRSLQSDNGIALAEVARLQKELKSALLQVDLAAGGALARVAELEVQLAHKTGEAEHLQHDLSVTRARGSVADALKKEIQVAEEKVKTLELERDAAKRAAAKAQELMDVAVAQLEKDSEANACLKKGVRGASSRGLPNQQLQNQMASEKSLRAANPGSLNREAGSQDDQADLQRSARALAVMEEAMIQIMHDHERKVPAIPLRIAGTSSAAFSACQRLHRKTALSIPLQSRLQISCTGSGNE